MYKIFGAAGLIAGGLRVIAPWAAQPLGADASELLYSVIDIGLILGLIGLYITHLDRVNIVGTLGFVIAVVGLSFIAGPDATLYGHSAYALGTPVIGLGVGLLAIALFLNHPRTKIGPILLLLSTALGISAMIGVQPQLLWLASGLLFGLGFVFNGLYVYRYR